MAVHGKQTGSSSLRVFDGEEEIAEIRDLRLCAVRFRRHGRILIGDEVPLPLYWQQYANHEGPERNTASHGHLRILEEANDHLTVECSGATVTESVSSRTVVTFRSIRETGVYIVDVVAGMKVREGFSWLVTPNPSHGEVEFCNLWPEGAYSALVGSPLRYDGCYVVRPGAVLKIPHHHAESSDKHNIPLRKGESLVWLLEDENLCVTVLSEEPVTAGVCAYMWDAHLAYKVCRGESPQNINGGTEFHAAFRLSSIGAEGGRAYASEAKQAVAPDLLEIPLFTDGIQTFSNTFGSTPTPPPDAWPWENEGVASDIDALTFSIDRTKGVDDHTSIRIDAARPTKGVWKATTLGPAFRQPSFPVGSRFRLVAFVATKLTLGSAGIGIRLHRDGVPDLFDPQAYEVYMSADRLGGTSDWTRTEVTTPALTPAPDRIHLLLDIDGCGTVWFDNVHFTVES